MKSRGFLFRERAKLALQSGLNEKPDHAKRDEVFVSPLVGVFGCPKGNPVPGHENLLDEVEGVFYLGSVVNLFTKASK